MEFINGFSKYTSNEKLKKIASFFPNPEKALAELKSYMHQEEEKQKIFTELTENAITNFHLPFSVAPNFLINGQLYHVPMVIEESSVVAAASKSAKFWASHGGFHCEVMQTEKSGQVHFLWNGNQTVLRDAFAELKQKIYKESGYIAERMKNRGGGIKDIQLMDKTTDIPNYYQLHGVFETADAMGANFINSCLEQFAVSLKDFFQDNDDMIVIMSILSNYTPNCKVRCHVETPVEDLQHFSHELPAHAFAQRFYTAVRIANTDTSRAVTHNKGIFNGMDAVLLATGNDWRAVEACGHAFAAKEGKYISLTRVSVDDHVFKYELEVPLALGTKGGITNIHPLVKRSLEMLGNPGAKELMGIAAAAGLANNFSALASLVTSGIQKGHMKMHLSNILRHFELDELAMEEVKKHFKEKPVSYAAVKEYIGKLKVKNQDKSP